MGNSGIYGFRFNQALILQKLLSYRNKMLEKINECLIQFGAIILQAFHQRVAKEKSTSIGSHPPFERASPASEVSAGV